MNIASNLAFHILKENGKNKIKKKNADLEKNCAVARSSPSPTTEKSAQNSSLGFLRLHAANDAHRKYCREKVPERESN